MPSSRRALTLLLLLPMLAVRAEAAGSPPKTAPAGEPAGVATDALAAGATALQTDAPPDRLDIYLDGFHPMKADPHEQMEAHHFCRQVNEDFAQCALFDGNTADANLTGVEYIISERLFATLPADERQYWHPAQRRDPLGPAGRARPAGGGREGPDAPEGQQLRQDLAHLEHRRRPEAAARAADAGLVLQPRGRGRSGDGGRARPLAGDQHRGEAAGSARTWCPWPGRRAASTR